MRPDFVSLPNPHPYRWVSGFRVTCRKPNRPVNQPSPTSRLILIWGNQHSECGRKPSSQQEPGSGSTNSSAHCYTKLHEMLDLFEIDRIHGDARHVSYKNGESLGKHGIVFATLGESFGESHAKWVFVLLNILTMGR